MHKNPWEYLENSLDSLYNELNYLIKSHNLNELTKEKFINSLVEKTFKEINYEIFIQNSKTREKIKKYLKTAISTAMNNSKGRVK